LCLCETFWMPIEGSYKPGRGVRKVLLVVALLLICIAIGLAAFQRRTWVVPVTEKAQKNPLTASDANLAAARKVYDDQCANCHGDRGKGDGPDAMMYDPSPSDLTDPNKAGKRSDGELFFQITEGKKPMPSFKKKLTEEQRWQLVLLVRSLAAQPK